MNQSWIESHRDRVGQILPVAIWCLAQGMLFARRLLFVAALLFAAALVFIVQPDTTVYQLSRLLHAEFFWVGAMVIACVYTASLWGAAGLGHPYVWPTGRPRKVVNQIAIGCKAR